MQEKNANPIKLKKGSDNTGYRLIVTSNLEHIIRKLCEKIPDREWSGVLFYKYEGSFQDNNLTIVCKHMLPMNIGTDSYTEWINSPEIINYMAKNDLLDCYTGIIHSHNRFKTTFSNIDLETLLHEGMDMCNAVSLIVNNFGDYSAAITRQVTAVSSTYEIKEYNMFNQSSITDSNIYGSKDQYVEYYMLNITKEFNEKDKIMDEKSLEDFLRENLSRIDNSRVNKAKEDSKETPKPDPEYSRFIYTLTLRLLTGETLLQNAEYGDIVGFIEYDMIDTYKKEFGENVLPGSKFSIWVDDMLHYIITSTSSDIVDHIPSEYKTDLIARNILIMLTAQKPNKYLDKIIAHLKEYYL